MEDINGKVTDHGVILKVEDIAWAGRQLWDSDTAFRICFVTPLAITLTDRLLIRELS
ncbi:hypothetical protein [Viscerimonas tarda]